MTEFENQVLADLAILQSEMKALLGNGQPGRLRQVELRVEQHEAMVQRFTGLGALIATGLTILHIGIDVWRGRH